MKTMVMRYPGDPAVKVELINRDEFFVIFPPENRKFTITALGAGQILEQECVTLGREIHCDFCNEDPLDWIALVGRRSAYCKSCFNKNLKRYCKETNR